jgi:hypothetical protein
LRSIVQFGVLIGETTFQGPMIGSSGLRRQSAAKAMK